MNVEIKTVSRKLTSSILNQIQEATVRDIMYAIEEGTILGYINPPCGKKQRKFLLRAANGDYRVVTNHPWEDTTEPTIIVARTNLGHSIKKTFSTVEAKETFKEHFKLVKRVALENHIYVA